MKKSKKFYITISIVGAVLLALFIVGSIFDLQISRVLADLKPHEYYTQNLFGIIFECIGEDVLYILIIFACALLFYNAFKNPSRKNWLNIVVIVFSLLLTIGISIYATPKTFNYFKNFSDQKFAEFISSTIGKIVMVLVGAIVPLLIFYLVSLLKKETLNSLFHFAIMILIVAALSNLIVQGSKLIFKRTRYRAMNLENAFEYYLPWFNIGGDRLVSSVSMSSDFLKSFPSGHTCSAASIFLINLLPLYLKKFDNKKSKITLLVISISYTVIVALSRIVAGAHFFTDVFVGGMVTIVIFYLFKWLYVDKKRFFSLQGKLYSENSESSQEKNQEENQGVDLEKAKEEEKIIKKSSK